MSAFGAIATTQDVLTQTVQYETPGEAGSVTIATNSAILILNPSGALSACTVTMPASPADKSIVCICSSQAITTLTLTSAKTVNGGIATLAANAFAQYIYNSTADKWFRCG